MTYIDHLKWARANFGTVLELGFSSNSRVVFCFAGTPKYSLDRFSRQFLAFSKKPNATDLLQELFLKYDVAHVAMFSPE
jgi:hypothetical protein